MASFRAAGPLRMGGDVRLSVAGSESNVAIGLARLGHLVEWVGVTGDDELGALVLRTLRAEDVGVARARADPSAPTGLMVIESRVAGRARVEYRRTGSAGARLSADDLMPALEAGPRVLHVTGITLALGERPRRAVLDTVAEARRRGVLVCFDVNYRSGLWERTAAAAVLDDVVRHTDVLVASADELDLVAPGAADPATALLERGVAEVVVTDGVRGAARHTRDGVLHQPALSAQAVDTVGAGDAFVAGLLSGWLDGLDPPGRMRRAGTTAAFAVATQGDWEGLPTRRDLGLLGTTDGEALR